MKDDKGDIRLGESKGKNHLAKLVKMTEQAIAAGVQGKTAQDAHPPVHLPFVRAW